jgi:chemotaxis protein CheY-P-specific phosphatase CheC|tara:strand:+ start:528 stop:1136 length:609 start_codon:yes stop_codon:yes gene_type:complete
MEKISKELKAVAHEIFLKGYDKACQSFSSLSGEQVKIKNFELFFGEAPDLLQKIIKTKNPSVLITDIIGEAKGKSYLVFSEKDAKAVSDILIQKLKSLESNPDFVEIILKEVDNMVSAAVITEFSNQLELKIYGDVPKMIYPEDANKQWLANEIEDNENMFAILSSANFAFEDNFKICPYFIWILNKEFYNVLNHKKLSHAN